MNTVTADARLAKTANPIHPPISDPATSANETGRCQAFRNAWDDAFARMTVAGEQMRLLSSRQSKAYREAEATAPDASVVDLSAFVGFSPFDPATFDVDAHEVQKRAALGASWFPTAAEQAREFASYESLQSYQRAIQANLDHHGVSQLWDAVEAAGELEANAIDALLLTPAPDLAAVHWKLSHLFDQGGIGTTPSWEMKMVLPVLEDVKRLAEGGR